MKKLVYSIFILFSLLCLTNFVYSQSFTSSQANCFSDSYNGVCIISQNGNLNSQINYQVADQAIQYIGKLQYVWGGTSLTTGADCSGFVQSLYRKYAGIDIPRTSGEQVLTGQAVSRSDLQPGDLVFFSNTDPTQGNTNGVSHVGIYLGTGPYQSCTYIESPHTGAKVQYANLCTGYAAIDCQNGQSTPCYYGARRV